MLFDLLRMIESAGFAKGLRGSDRRHSEWTDSNIKSINNLNCSQDGHLGHSLLGWTENVFR